MPQEQGEVSKEFRIKKAESKIDKRLEAMIVDCVDGDGTGCTGKLVLLKDGARVCPPCKYKAHKVTRLSSWIIPDGFPAV